MGVLKHNKNKMVKWAIGAVVVLGGLYYFFFKSATGTALVAQAKAGTSVTGNVA